MLQHLSDEPLAEAIIIITPEKGKLEYAVAFHRSMNRWVDLRNAPNARVSFRRRPEGSEFKVQIWKVATRAALSSSDGTPWPKPELDLSRPFIYGTEDEMGICSTFVPRVYAELIKQNPSAMGHIVVYEAPGSVSARSFANDWLQNFADNFDLPKRRFKVFLPRTKSKRNITYAEFWFVPAKNKMPRR
ncbi:MAG: hypothetical protein ABIV48_04365 [Pyrinomonadaceae bacterium]